MNPDKTSAITDHQEMWNVNHLPLTEQAEYMIELVFLVKCAF